MIDFAWIVHLRNLDDYWASLKGMGLEGAQSKGKQFSTNDLLGVAPYHYFSLDGLRSKTGKSIRGHFFICPLLPEQIVSEKQNLLEKMGVIVCEAKRLGVRMMGVAGLLGIYSKEIVEIAQNHGINVTNGKNYTAAVTVHSVNLALKRLKKNINELNVCLVGVGTLLGAGIYDSVRGEVGSLALVESFDKSFLNDKSRDQNDDIRTYPDFNSAAHDSDVVIMATGSQFGSFSAGSFKSNMILCDSVPPFRTARSVALETRDIFIYEGTWVTQKYFNDLQLPAQWDDIAIKKLIYCCLAETMVLSFEERFENFSFDGSNINKNRMKEMFDLGTKHGFGFRDFYLGGNKSTLLD